MFLFSYAAIADAFDSSREGEMFISRNSAMPSRSEFKERYVASGMTECRDAASFFFVRPVKL